MPFYSSTNTLNNSHKGKDRRLVARVVHPSLRKLTSSFEANPLHS